MPNTTGGYGFIPVTSRDANTYNGAVNTYFIPASDATALFIGDPVVKTGESTADRGIPHVARVTAGAANRITGVVVGFVPDPDNKSLKHRLANTARTVMVADDPALLCKVKVDGTYAVAQCGLNANVVYTSAGDASSGTSGARINIGTAATTDTFQCNIKRLYSDPANEPGLNADILVSFNQHTESNGTAGI